MTKIKINVDNNTNKNKIEFELVIDNNIIETSEFNSSDEFRTYILKLAGENEWVDENE